MESGRHGPRSVELRKLCPAQQPVYGMSELMEESDGVCNTK